MPKNESSVAKTDLTYGDFPQFKRDAKGRMKVPDKWRAPDGFRGTVITSSGIELSYAGRMRRARTIAEGE